MEESLCQLYQKRREGGVEPTGKSAGEPLVLGLGPLPCMHTMSPTCHLSTLGTLLN